MPTTLQFHTAKTSLKKRFKQKAGFTLAEVMIAFTIMVTGVTGSLTALASSLKSLDTARCSTLATQMAQSRIESLRLNSWDFLTGETNPSTSVLGSVSIDPVSLVPTDAQATAARFTLTQTIAKVAGREDEMLEITITAVWNTMGSIRQTRTFTTRYVRGGLYDYYNRHS